MRTRAYKSQEIKRIRNHRKKQSKRKKKCYVCGVEDNDKLLNCDCIPHHQPLIGDNGDA